MRTRFVLLAAALLAAGCSSTAPLPMATTPAKARPALETVLAAWKAGKSPADLKALSPPAYFLDADFTRGQKLVDFKIDGDGTPTGTGLRYDVTLTLADGGKGGKKVAYRVVTEPNTSVSREDF